MESTFQNSTTFGYRFVTMVGKRKNAELADIEEKGKLVQALLMGK
jgi:hypothetical protein